MGLNNPDNIINLTHVTLNFSADAGVFDLNLYVEPGTIFGLIGPSGCGKTTTVRLMTGIYKPQQGTIQVLKQIPSRFSARTRSRIGYMPQSFVLYPNLTTWENLNFVASLYGMNPFTRGKRLKQLLEFVELRDASSRLCSQLSGGMKRRLELACALAHDPILLFADEPTAGIDPVLRAKFWDHFRNLRAHGHTLFVTTQYVGEATYCNLVGVMREGRLLYVQPPEELRRTALGGEVIRLVVDPQVTDRVKALLRADPRVEVRKIEEPTGENPGTLLIYVREASESLPAIFDTLKLHPEITVHLAEEYLPPFDDIFVMLMQQADKEHDQPVA